MIEFPRLYPDIDLPDPESLKKPPLTQRVAQFWFDVSQEEFDEKLPTWLDQQMADSSFEKRQMTELWELRVELKGGGPPRPKATLTQVPKLTKAGKSSLTLELYPPKGEKGASLKIWHTYDDEAPTTFLQFQKECHRWLGSIMNHFRCKAVSELSLTYQNEFSKRRYPDYWSSESTVRLGLILRVLNAMPNPENSTFLDNFVIDFSRELLPVNQRALRFQLGIDTISKKSSVWLTTLTFSSQIPSLLEGDIETAMVELAGGHSYIFEEFCMQFTPEALALFSQ